jgi:glycosyltransferase involved in cell wall biosynthesis
MKIVFLIQDITTEGGTERTTCCIAEELHRRGHEVSVVSVFHNEPEPHYTATDVPFIYLSHSIYTARKSPVWRLGQVARRIRDARRCRPLQEADVIICQKILASTLAYLSGFRRKSIAAEHFTYDMYTPAVRQIRRMLYARMRAVVTLTEKDRALYRKENLEHVYCIPNMISVTPLPYQGAGSRRILSVGRLMPQKGYDLLLEAVHGIADRMGDYYVEIYGEGEERGRLETQCLQMGLTGKVRFCGYTDSIEQIYATSAFYVMSSRFEGFPMVLLEAAACGLPVVSFDCPEGPAVILKDGGGILVERENTRALGEALLTMIQSPERQEQYRGQLAQVIRPYSPANIGEQWEQVLQSIWKENKQTHER